MTIDNINKNYSNNFDEQSSKSPFAFRTIGEVAKELDIAQHVLRFWESKFKQISPLKRRGRRYYSLKDIETLKEIKNLLYSQGFTIKGVQKYLINKAKNSQEDLFITNDLDVGIVSPPSNNNPEEELIYENLSLLLERLEKIKLKIKNSNSAEENQLELVD